MEKFLIIILLVSIIFLSGCNNEETEPVSLTEEQIICIASNSELYVSSTCVACLKQEKILADSFDKLNVIDCSKNTSICIDKKIFRVPTWIIKGQEYEGVMQIEEILNFTGCE